MKPVISVVVPTCRRPELLDRCLDALLSQSLDPSDYEVLVADDAASAATRRQVERRATGGSPALRYLAVEGAHGPAAARNVGWRAARAEVVAFTDDDTVPDPDWLRAGLAVVQDGADAAWGRIVMPLPEKPTDYQRDAARLETAEFATANCFCRRAALESVGGFDERFRLAWREDSDLFFALLERGARVVPAQGAVVVHPARPAPWGISLRQQGKSLFNALLYKKHPELYRERIQGAPPWHYYCIVASLLAAIGGLLARNQPLALAGSGAWTLLTARFCASRLAHTSREPSHVVEMILTSALIPPLAVFWRLAGALRFRVLFL